MWMLASAVLGMTLLPALAVAEESIRVLLYQDAHRVQAEADSDLVVRLPGGEPRVVASTLVITPLPRAILVNGEHIALDRVIVTGEGRDLHVTAEEPIRTPKETRGLELSPAVFVRASSGSRQEEAAKHSSGSTRREKARQAANAGFREGLVVGGELEILSDGERLAVVNHLDLEEYVQGVVPAEMPASWHPEALKVQAVAARTYVLHQKMLRAAQAYDVVATVLDQVYRGRSVVNDRVRLAVEETKGLVLTHHGRPILATFSSTAAGPTEDAANVWSKDLPYLKGVDCPFDTSSPFYRWRTSFGLQALEQKLKEAGLKVGTIATLTPYIYSEAGRVTKLRILHSMGELMLSGQDLRRIVGYRVIPSTQFTLDELGPDVFLSGYGSGHAVGLCQWGAKELAELGYPFSAILTYYYPGTRLSRSWSLDPIDTPMP